METRIEGALKAILVSSVGRVWVDAGRLNVDFALTGPWPQAGPAGARWEGLHAPGDLSDWLSASRLGLAQVVVSEAELRAAFVLRAALWELIRATVAGRDRPSDAVGVINKVAAGRPLTPLLHGSDRVWRSPTAVEALVTIARDAIDLHADPVQVARLRECASDDCPRPFYDTSRPGTRRWCDPVRCGDRQRARTYRSHQHRRAPLTAHV